MALGGAVMAASYFLAGRVARRTVPVGLYGATVYSCSAAFPFSLGFAFPPAPHRLQRRHVAQPGSSGFGFHCGGGLNLNWALKYLPASMVSVSIWANL